MEQHMTASTTRPIKFKAKRLDNGMKKVKCTDEACDYYEQK